MKIKNIFYSLFISALFLAGLILPSGAQYSSNKPLFIEISTEWCGACKILKPVIEELKQEYSGKVEFVLLDGTSEQSVIEAEMIAEEYGIRDFFNNNKNAFPRVGIFCSSSSLPDHNLLGAMPKENYRTILNDLLYNKMSCELTDSVSPEVADLGPERPEEPNYPAVEGNRPEEPVLSDRPGLPVISGRPEELSFWKIGQSIPLYAYFQYFLLPECNGNSIICANYNTQSETKNNSGDNAPVFEPWNPNATRNEKGFDLVKKKG